MDIIEIIITSIGLAMDSCTMAICLGISMKKFKIKETLYIGFWFGLFQALMPLIGYLLGNTFAWLIYRICLLYTSFAFSFTIFFNSSILFLKVQKDPVKV